MNRKLVYDALAHAGDISRAELARQTGISAPTIGKIISFFVKSGIVSEAGEGESDLGRKPLILRFNSESFFAIGVEFEGGDLKIGVVDLLGRLKATRQIPVSADFDTIIRKELGTAIKATMREAGVPASRVWGVGIGIPGVVNIDRGTVSAAPLVGIIGERDCTSLISELQSKLRLPVFLENDVNAAAIGEYISRREQDEPDLVYLSLGTGVGGGIILNGELWKGKRFLAGEIGYMIFDKASSSHTSKAGWLESRINRRALIKNKKSSDFTKFAASELALVIANLSVVLDVDLFVVGGAASGEYGDGFLDLVGEEVRRLSNISVRVERQQCTDPGVTGAAVVAIENTIDEKLHS